jgi:hypothetical protein
MRNKGPRCKIRVSKANSGIRAKDRLARGGFSLVVVHRRRKFPACACFRRRWSPSHRCRRWSQIHLCRQLFPFRPYRRWFRRRCGRCLASRVSAIVASVAVRIPGGSGVTGRASAAVVDRRTIAVVDGRPVAAGVGVVIARRASAIVVDGVRMLVSSCREGWF